jgi:hypothetical protein
VLIPNLPRAEATSLLEERRKGVVERRAQVAAFRSDEAQDGLVGLALDHLLAHIDADLNWTDRAIDHLRSHGVIEPIEHAPDAQRAPLPECL